MKIGTTIRLIIATILLSAAACSSDSTPEPTIENPFEGLTGLELASKNFGPDPYSIGRDWYIYEGNIHAVFPEEWVYVIRRGNDITLLEFVSYYDADGESGFFTIHSASYDGESWTEQPEFVATNNVKEAPVCLTLSPIREVACDDDAVLVLRTAWRPVPQAGFAVQEPAIYLRSHFSQSQDVDVAIIVTDSIADVERDADALRELETAPSTAIDPRHARVGWIHDAAEQDPRTDVQLQITSNLQIAQWQVSGIDYSDNNITLQFNAFCQQVTSQQEPFGSSPTSFDVIVDRSTSYAVSLVQVCDPSDATGVSGTIVDTDDKPTIGFWPDSKTFDLIVEQLNGRVSIRLAPGQLLWNWTRAKELTDTTFDPIDLDVVWDEQLQ